MTPPAASRASAAPHIFTLTGNLLAERTFDFAAWSPGRTQRAQTESFQVGGKGVNVARMLHRLGTPNTALCFAGGPPGAECVAWLAARGLAHRAFATTAATRTGLVVRDAAAGHPETTFLGADAPPDAGAVRACADFLDAQPAGQVLALCGSFPGWSAPGFDPLRAALERWLARGHLVADTYGPPLAWAVARPLALVKVNADEIRSVAGVDGTANQWPGPVRRWVVSDGPRPVLVRDEAGRTHPLVPPPVREVSATGSGDVLLACVLHGWFVRGLSLPDAVAFALPFAAANAAHPGIAEFPDSLPSAPPPAPA